VARAVAVGERLALQGYALAGVEVVAADDPRAVREAIEQLADDVALLILGAEPDADLRGALARRPWLVSCSLTT
jgi:vacuolar-type H+-ATPase subunit F/Vma7